MKVWIVLAGLCAFGALGCLAGSVGADPPPPPPPPSGGGHIGGDGSSDHPYYYPNRPYWFHMRWCMGGDGDPPGTYPTWPLGQVIPDMHCLPAAHRLQEYQGGITCVPGNGTPSCSSGTLQYCPTILDDQCEDGGSGCTITKDWITIQCTIQNGGTYYDSVNLQTCCDIQYVFLTMPFYKCS
jgi:hypothetical protein